MQYYTHNLDLPYSKLNIKFREFSTNEQLVLSKTNLSTSYSTSGFLEYFNFLNEVMQNCIKNYNDILELDIIEFVMLITKIRSISIGNTIEFFIENTDNPDIKKQKITLNLNYFIKSLYDITNELFDNENNKITDKNISIYLKYPSIKSIDIFSNIENYDSINNSIVEFIHEIHINDNKINFKNFTLIQKQEILDKLSINTKQKIEIKIFDFLNKLAEKNLLGLEHFKEQKFTIYGIGFMSFIKMFFSYDVKSLYSELHYLASNGLPPDYILSISPSERKLYISLITEINNSKSQSSSSNSAWANLVNDHQKVENNNI
jgi:hypothetical protein